MRLFPTQEVKVRQKERMRIYHKEYMQRPKVKEKTREYNQRPEVKLRRKEYCRRYHEEHKHEVKERVRLVRESYRQQFLSIYGKRCFVCKDEVTISDLSVHHINGDGPGERLIMTQYSILKKVVEHPDLTRYATSHRNCHNHYHHPKTQTDQDKREYYQRPEVKERMRIYRKGYRQRPENKERMRIYHKERNQRPDIKERRRKEREEPEAKKHKAEYDKKRSQRPEIKERRRVQYAAKGQVIDVIKGKVKS